MNAEHAADRSRAGLDGRSGGFAGVAVRATTRIVGTLVLLTAAVVLGGCATSRSEIKVAAPASVASPSAAARPVVLRSIKDERVFEQAPRVASIPSLGFEGAARATDEVKARAIGRKRNTFGQALGDILLEGGQTVTGLVRDSLTAAFQQAGYRVVGEAAAGAAPLVVDVRIKQFWAWFQPGFWAITLSANIETDIDIAGGGAPVTISVQAQDSRQIATDSAWLEIVEKALAEYRTRAATRLGSPPF